MKTRKPDRGASIRRRLLALLVVPATLVLLAGTIAAYFSSTRPVRDIYDQVLANDALAISAGVRARSFTGQIVVRVPAETEALLRSDPEDKVYFSVMGPQGTLLAGDPQLPVAPANTYNPAFANMRYLDQVVRVATFRKTTSLGLVTTTVAETLNKRKAIRSRLWSQSLIIDLLELLAILGAVWLGVSIALQPLSSLGDQIERRSPRDLEPIRPTSVPVEVRTVVSRLNTLLNTIAESSRAERQFLESAAHQLRTPLAGLLAQIELLAADESAPARRQQLEFTLEAARRLSRTTQQLLALSRAEHAAYASTEVHPVRLAELAERCLVDYLERAGAKGVDLGADLQPATISGVDWLLGEALGNLIDNALTYTPTGGLVTVRCGLANGAAFLEVVDSGTGIAVDERTRVTERFYRGSHSLGSGSGLGLSIVADVARRHGATLHIDGGPEGRGTVVRLVFPATAGPDHPRASPSA